MKTILFILAFLPALCLAQIRAGLPSNASTLAGQFEAYEERTMDAAQKAVSDARLKLMVLLEEEARKAAPADAMAIRGYLDAMKIKAREEASPSVVEFVNAQRTVAGFYNNNPVIVVKVDTTAKKRRLVIHGNQATASTVGEIFYVRDDRNESKIGEWRKGQAGPLVFDVSGFVTKPGEYRFKLRYKDGGDEFVCDKAVIQVTKN